jgi:hypothetical protein
MGKLAKWRTFPREEVEEIVKNSISIREVAEKLGYKKDGGGTITSLHKMFEEYNLDTSHFKGQAWNKENYDYNQFDKFTYKKRGKTLLAPLTHLRGEKCERCGLSEWQGEKLPLQVHHIDGDRTNNSLENLMVLCPNCHSLTENFAGKNIGRKREKTDEEFLAALYESSSIAQALRKLELKASGSNYERAWKLIYENDIDHLKKKEH